MDAHESGVKLGGGTLRLYLLNGLTGHRRANSMSLFGVANLPSWHPRSISQFDEPASYSSPLPAPKRLFVTLRAPVRDPGASGKFESMKPKYEGKDLQGLVDLGREQGYLTFDQVNDFLPQDVASPTDLRAALDSFEDLDIKVLEEVPTADTETAAEEEAEEAEPEAPAPAAATESVGESSDPVRLYLKEMGNFQLLSREQEVEIAKRIEAGEMEVEEEVLGSPVTLDRVIEIARARARRAKPSCAKSTKRMTNPRPIPMRNAVPRPTRSSSRNCRRRSRSSSEIRTRLDEFEEELFHGKVGPRRKPKLEKDYHRTKERVKKELRDMALSPRLQESIIGEMRRLLHEYLNSERLIARYEEETGRTKNQLIKEAGEAEDRRHVLKVGDSRENLLDIAQKIRDAQKAIKAIEKRVKATGEDYARKLETIAAGQSKSRRAKKELTEANLRLVVSLGEALHQSRARISRPDPGREHRPDARGRQIRVSARLQILHLCNMVDSPIDVARDRRPGPHHPYPGAYGRDDQQAAARDAGCWCSASAASRARRKLPSRWRCRSTRSRRCSRSSKSRFRWKLRSATRKKVRSAISSRTSWRPPRSRPRFRATSASRPARCSRRSRRARSKSCGCVSVSVRRPTTRSRKSASSSRSPASASARSRRRRCASCARPAARATSRASRNASSPSLSHKINSKAARNFRAAFV